jgi:hypothetical protein
MEQSPFAAMLERSIQSCSTYDTRVDKLALLKQIVHVRALKNETLNAFTSEGEPFVSPSSLLMNCEDDEMKAAITPETFANQAEPMSNDFGLLAEPPPSSDAESLRCSSHRISTSIAPCHVDKSALRAYFTENEYRATIQSLPLP